MKTYTYTVNTYNFNELSENAKQNAIHEFYNDYNYLDIEYELYRDGINFDLAGDLPNSNLSVIFDFSCNQGSGLNITGELNLFDFLDKWIRPEEEKEYIKRCILYNYDFKFSENNHYCYSCKFMDVEKLEYKLQDGYDGDGDPDEAIISKFAVDCIEYFENLEKMYYNDPVNDESIIDYIINSDLEFTEEGRIYGA